jgi:hypothetical protein
LSQWLGKAVKSLKTQFLNDNGSLKKKYEDGVLIGTYENKNQKASTLLKVQVETNDLNLQPLFQKTEGMYFKLDRKLIS